ncbi:YaaR family protein [Caldalkalibacillus salinus]|uniref:YaaR family protein n=1 Tax=Caldalkalibacillus salinus TaxID=2803787 RepID=UPI0019223903|nr:YaaR family protein [Caldalkalibacillus salinus]
MRIENHVSPKIETTQKGNPKGGHKTSFSTTIAQTTQTLHEQSIRTLLSQIDVKGRQLGQHMTVGHLKEYKKLVKELIQETVQHGLELHEKQNLSPKGRSKQFKTVKEIDKALVSLTNEVLEQEQNQINILSLIEDIKGMMVNLYT